MHYSINTLLINDLVLCLERDINLHYKVGDNENILSSIIYMLFCKQSIFSAEKLSRSYHIIHYNLINNVAISFHYSDVINALGKNINEQYLF